MSDPYTSTKACADRLISEWKKYGRIVIAVDVDGTVFDYHKTGEEYTRAISLIRRASKIGAHICIFTARSPERWDEAISYFSEVVGVEPSSVNANPISLPYGNHGKMYYNILLDDRAGLGQALDILEEAMNQISDNLSS